MIGTLILNAFAAQRNLKVQSFDLAAAIEENKTVVLWHTTNCRAYIGYVMHKTDVTKSRLIFTDVAEHTPGILKLHDMYFVECDGCVQASTVVWPKDFRLFLGDRLVESFRLNFVFEQAS